MKRLIIRGARLLDPTAKIDAERDLLLESGRVRAVERPGSLDALADAERLEAKGLVAVPGLIDVHVHLREPGQMWKETIRSGTAAAAAGGFTTVVAMPNTVPVNDTAERLKWMVDAKREAQVRLLAMPAVTLGSMGNELTDFAALASAGAVGFTDDGKPVLGRALMRAALVAAARLDLPISQHAEDTTLTRGASMNAGALSFRLGLRGMPVEAESGLVERDVELLREIERAEGLRAHLHVQHVSTAKALEVIRRAKRQGLHVTCEATPHHFALNEHSVGDYDTHAKMNPPLRAEVDRLAVIEGLLDGTVDCIATDHAPHARFEKEVEFERAANGITGLETALGTALQVLGCVYGATLMQLLTWMSTNPARVLGAHGAKLGLGSLAVGSAADVVLLDPAEQWTYDVRATRSKSRNSPFDGMAMRGRVRTTIVGGAVIFDGHDR